MAVQAGVRPGICMMAVPTLIFSVCANIHAAGVTDAVMEASWPGWSDTGALMLVALAVILALTESQKQKIHNR